MKLKTVLVLLAVFCVALQGFAEPVNHELAEPELRLESVEAALPAYALGSPAEWNQDLWIYTIRAEAGMLPEPMILFPVMSLAAAGDFD